MSPANRMRIMKQYTHTKITLDMYDVAELLGVSHRYAQVLAKKFQLFDDPDPVQRTKNLIALMSERGQI